MSTASPTDLAELEKRAVAELAACTDEAALRAWNNHYFGKAGELALALRRIGEVPGERGCLGRVAGDEARKTTRLDRGDLEQLA